MKRKNKLLVLVEMQEYIEQRRKTIVLERSLELFVLWVWKKQEYPTTKAKTMSLGVHVHGVL